ncbi:MAG: hypothetical protein J6C27_04985 [Clostridia bacterium]|nr:hypothetical protein [Clostridia bacterium]
MKIYGIYIALSGAYITEVIFATIVYFTGKWKTPEYKELERQEKNAQPLDTPAPSNI